MKWFRRAADQGSAVAQSNLGLMYANGEGVAQDNAEAEKWLNLAANQGDEIARQNLASLGRKQSNTRLRSEDGVASYASRSLQNVASAETTPKVDSFVKLKGKLRGRLSVGRHQQ